MDSGISKIIHVDMDAFYASVEQRDNPRYRGKPLVVGGSPNSRGVVCTASYEARKFGIHSAMPCSQAKRLCPEAIFVSPNLSKYKEVSNQLRKIFYEVTDIVEPLSLDEAFLDVTQNKFNEPSATLLAKYIKSRVKGQLNLTASAGISSIKFIAKLASDLEKPDGITTVPPNEILKLITALPVKKLWGVGPSTEKKLHALGLYTIKDIQKKDRLFLFNHLGKQGQFLHDLSYGRDFRKVGDPCQSKSIAQEQTFSKDLVGMDKKLEKTSHFAYYLSQSLKKQNLKIKTVTIKVKFSDFSSRTKSRTIDEYGNSEDLLIDLSTQLLKSIPEIRERPVRLIGIAVRNFEGETRAQGKNPDQFELPLSL